MINERVGGAEAGGGGFSQGEEELACLVRKCDEDRGTFSEVLWARVSTQEVGGLGGRRSKKRQIVGTGGEGGSVEGAQPQGLG
jgi:hypothetical protein